jgi:hypothetical protein
MAIAYGYVDLQHVFKHRIGDLDSGVQIVREANARQLQYANAMADTMLSSLCQTVTQAKIRFEMASGGTMQPLDDDGNPLPTLAYEGYDVGFPIRGAGDAMGTNRISRAMMTVEEANNAAQSATIKDKNWLIDHMLAAILTNTSYTFVDRTREGYLGTGEVTIMGLANGDGTRYIGFLGRALTDGTHTHYLRLDLPGAASNPFPTIHKHLREHTGNTDEVVDVYIAENLEAGVRLVPGFVERADADIQQGANTAQLRANADKGIGDEVIGKVSKCWIITMGRLPDNYMIGIRRGGQPLGRREYPVATLQGLFKEENNVDGNHLETRWLRFTGFGGRDRTAAVAVLCAASGSYAPPADLTAPLAQQRSTA